MKAEKGKLTKYDCLAAKFIVMPIAFETLGPMAPMGLQFIKEIGAKIAEITGDKRSTSHLFQRLGISTQLGNASSVEGTVRDLLEELYYL